jgi:rifampin ADP-ribosylating transferase
MAPEASKNQGSTGGLGPTPFAQTYFHGTKADLKIGDLIEAGFTSNYGQQNRAKYIFLSATLVRQSGLLSLPWGKARGEFMQ